MASALAGEFKKLKSFEERQKLSSRVLESYPDRVPVIVEKELVKEPIPEISKKKFLSPRHITVAQFMAEMRGFLPDLDPGLSIFTFTKDRTIPSPASTMEQVYERCKDDDGFLYLTYTAMMSFGGAV